MADEKSNPGTLDSARGDAAEHTQTTENQSEEGREAASGKPNYEQLEKMYLESKTGHERAKQLEAELAELREERAEHEPAARSAHEVREEVDDVERRAREFALKGDPVAEFVLRTKMEGLERENRLIQEISNLRQLDKISDEAEQREVLRHFQKNRNRLGDVNAALAEVRSKKLAEENLKLREELKKALVKPDSDVVRTEVRDATAGEIKSRKMTLAEFDRRVASLAAEGRHKEKMALQNQLRKKEIELTG